MTTHHSDIDEEGSTLTRHKIKRPPMYCVLFLNDDFTHMQFVVQVLTTIFNLSLDEATNIMLKIHKEGKARVGHYTFEVASHKADMTNALARKSEFPLLVAPEAI